MATRNDNEIENIHQDGNTVFFNFDTSIDTSKAE